VAQGYLWRGIAEMSNKLYDKASADLKTALQKSPDNPAVYLSMGQLALVQGHYSEAQSVLQKSLDRDPNSYRALALLVLTDMQAKQPAKAISRVQAQIAKQPQNGIFYAQLADLQLRTNDAQGALASSQKALQLAPNNPEVTTVYTRAQVALGNIDPAIDLWQKWIASNPNDSRGPQIVGTLEEAKGDTAKAQDFYKKALQLNPSDGVAANNLAYIMAESGQNPDVALSLAQTARRSMPDSPQTADTLAWVYYAKGNYSSARDLLESSLKTAPDEASLQYHLGMTYLKLKDMGNAQNHLKRAQALSPNTKIGKDAGAQLQKL
jgi:tetratricopeptide (TPR) repeat protein